jgi:integrase/recombinase XerC
MTNELHEAIGIFIATIANPETARAYSQALARFEKIAPAELSQVDETLLMPFADSMPDLASASKDLKMSAVISFFAFLVYTKRSDSVSLDRARMIKKKLGGRAAIRISNYPMKELQSIVDYARDNLSLPRIGNAWQTLIALRDRALILTLATTGLRRAEAARMKLSDVDFEQGQAVIIGKGNKQAVIYFTPETLQAVRDYIAARPNQDAGSPLFMRHDKAKGADPDKHITPQAVAHVIHQRAREVLGYDHPKITPHSLRHYFVSKIWSQSHDLMLAKELARHDSVLTTQRYTHIDDDQLKSAHRRVFE